MSVFSNAVINVVFNKADALKGLKQVKEQAQNTAGDMKKAFMKSIGSIGTAFLGFKAFKQVYNDSLKIVDLADKWGRPVEGISQFSNKMALLGGTTEDAMNTVDSLEQAIIDLTTKGTGPLKEVSAQIRANIYNADGSIKTGLELLDEIREKFKNIKDDATRTKVAQELGLTSPAQLKYLKLSDAEFKKLNKDATKYGFINFKNAKQLKEFRESITKLKMSFSSVAGSIMTDFKPVIDAITKGLKAFSDLPEDTRKTIVEIAGALGGLKLADNLFGITDAISGLSKALLGLGKVSFTGIAKGIGLVLTAISSHPIIASIIALSTGLMYLYKLWNKEKDDEEHREENRNELLKDRNSPYRKIMELSGVELPKESYASDYKAGEINYSGKTYSTAEDYSKKHSTAEDYGKEYSSKNPYMLDFSKIPNSSTTNSTVNNNKSIRIDNINIKSTDPYGASQELQNVLNRQFADGVI